MATNSTTHTNRRFRPQAIGNWLDLNTALLAAMDEYDRSADSSADRLRYYAARDAVFTEAELRDLANWA